MMIALKTILVATDFSAASDTALTYGQAMARLFGATLHVLHVADDIYLRMGGEASILEPQLQLDVENGAREQLNLLLVDSDPIPLPTTPVVVVSSAPARAIVSTRRKRSST